MIRNKMTKAHKHKDLIIAWANGETIQFWGYGWIDVLEPNFNSDAKFRVKPKTISINGIEVPTPEQQKLSEGTRYYVPCLEADDWINWYEWSDASIDKRVLGLGIIHLTREAAEQHAKALLSFTNK